jgi:hypothetical protein
MTVRFSPLNFTRALRARGEPLGAEEDTSLREIFVVLLHCGKLLAVGGGLASNSLVALPMTMKRTVLS